MEYELRHHGVKGQKWGVRRYQTQSGAYTDLGRKHYGIGIKDLEIVDASGKSTLRVKLHKAKKAIEKASDAVDEKLGRILDGEPDRLAGQRWGPKAVSKKAGMSNWIKKSLGKSESEKSEQQKMVDANKKLLEEAMKRSTEGLQKKGHGFDSSEPHKALLAAVEKGDMDAVRSLVEQNKDNIDELISKAALSDKHAHSMSDVSINEANIRRAISDVKGDSGSKPAELKSETAPGKSEINKSLSEMSDKELDSIVKRLENEQKLQKAIDVLYANSQNKNPIEQRISYDDPRSMTAAQMQKAIAQMNQETAYSKALADYLTPKKSFSQQMIDVGKSAVKEVLLDQAKSFTKDFTEGLIEGLGNELANADWEKIIASLNNKKKK